MESFLLSTVLSFLFYELLAYMRPPREKTFRIMIGEVGIKFGKRSAVWAGRTFVGLIIAFGLIVILSLHNLLPTVFLRNQVNIVLGVFCGPLLAIWLNSIFRLKHNQDLSKSQIVGGIGLVVLVILGSVSKEGGNLISQYAKHISSLSLPGGTQLQFTATVSSNTTAAAPSAPPAGKGQGNVASFVPSQGLQIAGHLQRWFMEPDIDYLALFKLSNETLDDKLKGSQAFAENIVEPPFRCLSGWSRRTADDSSSIDTHVRAFAEAFRYLHDLPKHKEAFIKQFAEETRALVDDVGSFGNLVKDYNIKPPSEKNEPPCNALLRSFPPDTDPPTQLDLRIKAYKSTIEKAITDDKIVLKDEFEQRPYLAILHASLMAQLGQYPAAGAILENWLDSFSPASQAAAAKAQVALPTGPEGWFELRARSVLATYLEEWIKREEPNVTTPMRNEHLNNLRPLRRGLRDALGRTTDAEPGRTSLLSSLLTDAEPERTSFFSRVLTDAERQGPIRFVMPGKNCAFEPPKESSTAQVPEIVSRGRKYFWQYLFSLFVTMELTYDLNTLSHPDYGEKYAEDTTDSLRALTQLDLSCVPQGSDRNYAQVLYAQILEAYARNAILLTDARRDAESDDAKQGRLDEAMRVAHRAEEISKSAEPDYSSMKFAERIIPNADLAVEEALKTDTLRLKSLMEK